MNARSAAGSKRKWTSHWKTSFLWPEIQGDAFRQNKHAEFMRLDVRCGSTRPIIIVSPELDPTAGSRAASLVRPGRAIHTSK